MQCYLLDNDICNRLKDAGDVEALREVKRHTPAALVRFVEALDYGDSYEKDDKQKQEREPLLNNMN